MKIYSDRWVILARDVWRDWHWFWLIIRWSPYISRGSLVHRIKDKVIDLGKFKKSDKKWHRICIQVRWHVERIRSYRFWSDLFAPLATKTIPWAKKFVDIAVAIECFGVGTSYMMVSGDLVPEHVCPCHFSHFFFLKKNKKNATPTNFRNQSTYTYIKMNESCI